jgi:hypothetical protein
MSNKNQFEREQSNSRIFREKKGNIMTYEEMQSIKRRKRLIREREEQEFDPEKEARELGIL